LITLYCPLELAIHVNTGGGKVGTASKQETIIIPLQSQQS